MFSYKKYFIYFILSLVVLSSGYFLHNRYVELIESNASLQNQITIQNESISELKRSIQLAEKHRIEYQDQTSQLQQQLRTNHSDLDNMKNRDDVILSRLSLVENMINRSMNNFIKQLSCETGAKELCEPNIDADK